MKLLSPIYKQIVTMINRIYFRVFSLQIFLNIILIYLAHARQLSGIKPCRFRLLTFLISITYRVFDVDGQFLIL